MLDYAAMEGSWVDELVFFYGCLLKLAAVSDAPLTVLKSDALTFSDTQLNITIHFSQCAELRHWRSMIYKSNAILN